MHLSPQGPGPFGSIRSVLAAVALTGSIHSLLAAPSPPPSIDISPRAANALDVPGLGVELEVGRIQYKPTGKDYNDMDKERKEQLKGAKITPIGFGNDHLKENWDITAELGGSGLPFTEIITDGMKNEIGKHKTKVLGQQIATYMVRSYSYFTTLTSLCSLS